MSKFAIIPDEVVCRLNELGKTEIIVLIYLYGRRNKKTGQCNPSRAEVARSCSMARPHVTPAFANLEAKGWIVTHAGDDGRQNFELTIPFLSGRPTLPFTPQKRGKKSVKKAVEKVVEKQAAGITDFVTPTLTDSVTPAITKSVTFLPENEEKRVTNSVTQCYEIRNSPYEIRNPPPYTILTDNEQTIEQRREEVDLSLKKNENEKSKNENQKSEKTTARGSRLPDPFLLTAKMRLYAVEKRPDVDVELETEKFVNYWRAKPGKDGRKLDWAATWRNWILSARGNYGNGTNRQPSEREKSAERSANGYRMVEELRRIAAEQDKPKLSGGDDGGDTQNTLAR